MNVICEKCGQVMKDVRAEKTNPKGPDFKCMTTGCKFQKNRATGQWEPSEYKTAKWMTDVATDQVSGPANAPQADMTPEPPPDLPPTITTSPTYHAGPRVVKTEPGWDAIAEGKVRHGVVCSLIEAGRTKEQILAEAPFWVKYIMGEHPQVPF